MAKDVKVNLAVLKRVAAEIPNRVFRVWAMMYRSFIQLRYDRFSKGGGNWKPLSKATLAARRRKGTRRRKKFKAGASTSLSMRPAILRDTGVMFNALSPEFRRRPGQLQKQLPSAILVGYGGPHRHPGGKATIADIASFHQTGEGRLPKREIIVDPDRETLDDMAKVVLKEKGLDD